MSDATLLRVQGLCKVYQPPRMLFRPAAKVVAVDDVSFQIDRGQTLALVGESGSGKTTVAQCLLRVIRPSSGHAWFDGVDLFALGSHEMRQMRKRVQAVFQDPVASLDPELTVEDIIAEGIDALSLCTSKTERAERVADSLRKVRLGLDLLRRRPAELSGGQRQRVSIARALVLEPELLICDEPTSALDVSVQAQILNLLADLQQDFGVSYLLITHDLAVAHRCARNVVVMSEGRVVEAGLTDTIFTDPQHLCTQRLLASADKTS